MALGDEVVVASDPKEEEEEEEEEEEVVDPQDSMKEDCSDSSSCQSSKARLDACTGRVSGGNTEETCEEELFDFMHCVDGCVSKTLFQKLK